MFGLACKNAGVKQISLLSAAGVKTGKRKYSEGPLKESSSSVIAGSMNYILIKSMIQDALTSQGFDRVSIFQPSLLVTPQARYGAGDSIVQAVFPKVKPPLSHTTTHNHTLHTHSHTHTLHTHT